VSGAPVSLGEYPVDTWKQIIAIDLIGLYLCCRAVVALMLSQGYGRIVNVTTIASKEGNANACAYSAAIAEVIALTNVPRQGTRNSRYRGELHTPAAAGMRIFDQMSQDHIDFMLSRIPRGRFLEVHEVSAMVTWLVLEENSFTTGAVFDLRGGRATY
jgi:NAD(P)-dependent dehydrogenase (short-subunit alcohol dehydrogenase family)